MWQEFSSVYCHTRVSHLTENDLGCQRQRQVFQDLPTVFELVEVVTKNCKHTYKPQIVVTYAMFRLEYSFSLDIPKTVERAAVIW